MFLWSVCYIFHDVVLVVIHILLCLFSFASPCTCHCVCVRNVKCYNVFVCYRESIQPRFLLSFCGGIYCYVAVLFIVIFCCSLLFPVLFGAVIYMQLFCGTVCCFVVLLRCGFSYIYFLVFFLDYYFVELDIIMVYLTDVSCLVCTI